MDSSGLGAASFLPNAALVAPTARPPPIAPFRVESIKRTKFSGVNISLFSSTNLTAAVLVISWRPSVKPSVAAPFAAPFIPRRYQAPRISLSVNPFPRAARRILTGVTASKAALNRPAPRAGSNSVLPVSE